MFRGSGLIAPLNYWIPFVFGRDALLHLSPLVNLLPEVAHLPAKLAKQIRFVLDGLHNYRIVVGPAAAMCIVYDWGFEIAPPPPHENRAVIKSEDFGNCLCCKPAVRRIEDQRPSYSIDDLLRVEYKNLRLKPHINLIAFRVFSFATEQC